MMYKALVSFTGLVSMAMGDVKEIESSIAKDLLKAGYVEKVEKTEKTTKKKSSKKGEK